MKLFLTISLSICLVLVQVIAFAQNKITAVQNKSSIDISINGRFFTSYIFSDEAKYPYFFPVNGPSGSSVTSLKNSDYPHHSSLFFGCDRVNGGNFWQEGLERGQIVSTDIKIIESGNDKVLISNECIWKRPDAPSPIKDYRTITISSPAAGVFQIDFSIVMEMLEDVTIAKTNHSLFSGRMDPDLAVINGGTLVNAEGLKGEKDTFGKASPWMDYYGQRGQKTEGMAILQHPSNPWYPSSWFTRDYGFFSPTPMYWPENENTGTQLRKGKKLTLNYRVIVHAGNTEAANISGFFEQYKSQSFK